MIKITITGHQGAGKTTLARFIGGLLEGFGLHYESEELEGAPAVFLPDVLDRLRGAKIKIETSNEEPKSSPAVAEPYPTYCETLGAVAELGTHTEELTEELGQATEAGEDKEEAAYRVGLAVEALELLEGTTARLRATLKDDTLPAARCGRCCACSFEERAEAIAEACEEKEEAADE